MSGQLTVGDLLRKLLKHQQENNLNDEEFNKLPVYLGDDDELNGVHCCWYVDVVDSNDEDWDAVVELINDRSGNNELNGKGVLIS